MRELTAALPDPNVLQIQMFSFFVVELLETWRLSTSPAAAWAWVMATGVAADADALGVALPPLLHRRFLSRRRRC